MSGFADVHKVALVRWEHRYLQVQGAQTVGQRNWDVVNVVVCQVEVK